MSGAKQTHSALLFPVVQVQFYYWAADLCDKIVVV